MKFPLNARQGLAVGAAAATVLLTGTAFWLSYEHLHDVAGSNGLVDARAWAWPATIDLFILIGELLLLLASLDRRVSYWAIALTTMGSLGSIALNVAGVGKDGKPLEYIVAAVPPVAALLAFGALMHQVHRRLMASGVPAVVPAVPAKTPRVPAAWGTPSARVPQAAGTPKVEVPHASGTPGYPSARVPEAPGTPGVPPAVEVPDRVPPAVEVPERVPHIAEVPVPATVGTRPAEYPQVPRFEYPHPVDARPVPREHAKPEPIRATVGDFPVLEPTAARVTPETPAVDVLDRFRDVAAIVRRPVPAEQARTRQEVRAEYVPELEPEGVPDDSPQGGREGAEVPVADGSKTTNGVPRTINNAGVLVPWSDGVPETAPGVPDDAGVPETGTPGDDDGVPPGNEVPDADAEGEGVPAEESDEEVPVPDPLVPRVQKDFAAELGEGKMPGVKKLKTTYAIGQRRAQGIRDQLVVAS